MTVSVHCCYFRQKLQSLLKQTNISQFNVIIYYIFFLELKILFICKIINEFKLP